MNNDKKGPSKEEELKFRQRNDTYEMKEWRKRKYKKWGDIGVFDGDEIIYPYSSLDVVAKLKGCTASDIRLSKVEYSATLEDIVNGDFVPLNIFDFLQILDSDSERRLKEYLAAFGRGYKKKGIVKAICEGINEFYEIEELKEFLSYRIDPDYPRNILSQDLETKKIPAKYYALLHWIKIELGKENHFEQNEYDQYPKEKMLIYFKNKYAGVSAQRIYQEFINIDIKDKHVFSSSWGPDYKEHVINASGNSADVIQHLRHFPS